MGEYAIIKNKLPLDAGLSAWNGLARYASSSLGIIMGLDLPLVEKPTNDVNDRFGRKLSVYAKGKLGKLDYRLTVADLLLYQKRWATAPSSAPTLPFPAARPRRSTRATFSTSSKTRKAT